MPWPVACIPSVGASKKVTGGTGEQAIIGLFARARVPSGVADQYVYSAHHGGKDGRNHQRMPGVFWTAAGRDEHVGQLSAACPAACGDHCRCQKPVGVRGARPEAHDRPASTTPLVQRGTRQVAGEPLRVGADLKVVNGGSRPQRHRPEASCSAPRGLAAAASIRPMPQSTLWGAQSAACCPSALRKPAAASPSVSATAGSAPSGAESATIRSSRSRRRSSITT